MSPITFQIRFDVDPADEDAFVRHVTDAYLPALARQDGFRGARLLRSYPPEAAAAIGAADDGYRYVLELGFGSEEQRLTWVAGPEHDPLWSAAVALSRRQSWCGYDEVAASTGDAR